MSKNKKSMKNSKKRVNNYKIESLEPRLMMDGNLDGWNQEILSAQAAINSSDVNSDIYVSASEEWRNSYVETLQHLNGEDYEQARASDIVAEGSFNNIFASTNSAIAKDFKNALRETVKDWLTAKKIDLYEVVENESQSVKYKYLFDIPSSISSSATLSSIKEFVLTAMADSDDNSLDYQSNQYLFASRSVDANTKKEFREFVDSVKKKCKLDTEIFTASDVYSHWVYSSSEYTVQLAQSNVANDSLLFEVSKNAFATLKGKDIAKFRTDITDFSGVSVKLGLRDKDNLRFEGQMHVQIDGDDGNLERKEIDSASVTAYFRQLNSGDLKRNFGYGEEGGPNGDPDEIVRANGRALALESSGVGNYTAGVDSNGDSFHEGELEFSVKNNISLGVTNASASYYYDQGTKTWSWVDSAQNPIESITKLENFRIGPVIQKLSDLAYWLHDNSTVTKNNPAPLFMDDFGGLLNQNVSEMAEFSALLNGILSTKLTSLNDFLPLIDGNPDVDFNANVLKLHFNLQGLKVETKSVSLLTDQLKKMGFEVADNQSLNLDVVRSLKFDLVVKLDDSLDLKGDTNVQDALGVDTEKAIGSVIGAAYVKADGPIQRRSLGEFYSVAVKTLYPGVGQTENVVSFTISNRKDATENYTVTITVDANDNAKSLIKKIENLLPDWAKNHYQLESAEKSLSDEYLFFTVDPDYSLTCTQTLNAVNCINCGGYYELLSDQYFSEKAVDCAYYDMGNITVSEGAKINVKFEYDTEKVDESFKYVSEEGSWQDGVAALIAGNSVAQTDKIQVKIVNYGGSYKLVLLNKNGTSFVSKIKNISVTIGSADYLSKKTYSLGYLYTSDQLPIDCSSWSGGSLDVSLSKGSSVLTDSVNFAGSEFNSATSLDDIVRIINKKIEANSSLNKKVVCETREGKITFRVVDYKNYSSIDVTGSLLTSLGFKVQPSEKHTNECLVVKLSDRKGGSQSYRIKLDSIDGSSTIENVDPTKTNIVDAIKTQCGGNVDFVDGHFVGVNCDIESIKNLNGCSIGSVLGIVGEAKDGCVFRVFGVDEAAAENAITFQNLELKATYTVSGLPYVDADLGVVNTKYVCSSAITSYLQSIENYQTAVQVDPLAPIPSLPTLFEHELCFKMQNGLVNGNVVSLPKLMESCKTQIEKLISEYTFENLFDFVNNSSSFASSIDQILSLKNVLLDSANKIAEFVDVVKKMESYFESTIVGSMTKFKTTFESIITQIKSFVEKPNSALDVSSVQKFLSQISQLGTDLIDFSDEYDNIKNKIVNVIQTAKTASANALSSSNVSFTITPKQSSVQIENAAGILAESFTLTDLAAQKKLQELGSSVVSTGATLSGTVANALSLTSTSLDEMNLKALGTLDLSRVFGSISAELEGASGFFTNLLNTDALDIKLPVLGRSLGDICGAFSVVREIQNFFKTAQNKTLQDMMDSLAKLGLTAIPQWKDFSYNSLTSSGSGKICIGLSKSLNVLTKKVQLDKLIGIGPVNLGGCLEAYLDVTAGIDFTIEIAYNYNLNAKNEIEFGEINASLVKSHGKTDVFNATVNLRIPSASADLNVSFGSVTSPSLKISGDGQELSFEFGCSVDIDTSNKKVLFNSLSVNKFTGSLNVESLGVKIGAIKFGLGGNSPISLLSKGSFDAQKLIPSIVRPKDFSIDDLGSDAPQLLDSAPSEGAYVDLSVLDFKSFFEMDLFEKLRLVSDALSESFRKMQSGLNKEVLSKTMRNIPFIGDKIVSVADCISMLDSKFIEPFRKYVFNAKGMSAETVAEKLYLMLNKAGILVGLNNCSTTPETWASKEFNKYYKGIQYFSTDSEARWHIKIGGKYTLDPNADFDIGLPGLGLRADGGVNIELEWSLDIGFGIDRNNGAYLLFTSGSYDDQNQLISGDDLNITLNVNVDENSVINGSLGFLEMEASFHPVFSKDPKTRQTSFKASLGVDLNDGESDKQYGRDTDFNHDKGKEQIYVSSLGSGLSVEANFDAQFNTYLKLLLTAGEMFPSVESNFAFEWESATGIKYVAFEDLTLNAGDFIDKMFGGIVKKVKKVIEPIQPLIDFLQSEIPVLNKLPAGAVHITVLDLIKQFGKGKMDFGFLDDIIQLNQIVKMLGTSHNGISLSLPDLVLLDTELASYDESDAKNSQDSRRNINNASKSFLNGAGANIDAYIDNLMQTFTLAKKGVSEFDQYKKKLATLINNGFDELSKAFNDGGLSVESRLDVKQAGPISSDPYGWQFPIVQEPIAQVVGLLMGKPADLVTYHMRPLVFNFNWANSYPIVGPLCADIGFNFGVCFDLKFGYDTYGMIKWKDSHFKDPTALLDGFYIADWDSSGKDIAEIVFHSGVVAGASVCGRAGINVALNLDVNLNFNDPNNDGKVRMREMAKMLSKPITMFDVSATIEMEAYAYLDYFIGRKKWVLWSSGAFELFDTASNPKPQAVLISDLGDDRVINVGDFAANRGVGDMTDGKDVVTITIKDSNKVDVDWVSDSTGASGFSHGATVSSEQILYIYAGEQRDTIKVLCADGVEAKFNIVIYGGAENDCVDLSGLNFADGYFAAVYGGAGTDVIKGAKAGTNFLFGDGGYLPTDKDDKKKVLSAYNYYDDEEIGNNIIYGGEGASNFIFGGFGFDQIAAGENDVNYIFGDGGRVDFGNGGAIVDVRSYDLYDEGGDDVIFGSSNIDHIYGGAGADHIDGGAGDDVIRGGKGHDVIYGGAGNDEIYGDDGVDIIYGDAPVFEDMLIANSTNKSGKRNVPLDDDPEKLKEVSETVIPWNYVSDELKKTSDDEDAVDLTEIRANRNIGRHIDKNELDRDFANMNPYSAPSSGGSDRIYGGNGSDIIFGDNGSDDSFAGGNDVIQGDAGNDFIDGDAGNDIINGDSGEDVIYGGFGDDVLDGGADNDIVFGDNGLSGYNSASAALDVLFGTEPERNAFGDALAAILKDFSIDGVLVRSDLTAKDDGGNDTIYAGNDSDFIDGQSGNDAYKISFMGGFYSAYTNIMDSGNDIADSMSVEGTIENDNLLVRASDKKLGMIALLPDTTSLTSDASESENSSQYKYEKKKIERINYWTNSDSRGIEQISLNAGAGDDKIAVDGTLSALAIDAGAGDDTITVGQMFKSERTRNDAKVAAVDEFSTTLTTQGFLSNGTEHPTTITGGLGNDTFNLLHASAATALVGGEGNDTFNIATFQKADKSSGEMLGVLQNAPVTLIGGVGGDKMNIVGSDGDDTFVVSGGSVQASGVDIQAVSIENQDVFGGAGDDSFYVLDTIENSVTHLYGNEGNDSFYNGGTQSDMPYIAVDNIDYKGHSGIIEHVVDSSTDKYMQTKAAAISVNIRDNDTATGTSVPVDILFVNAKGDIIEPSAIIEEGAAAETVYYLKLSRNLAEGERVTVNVYAPSLSEEAVQRGDRGFVFVKGEQELKTLSVTFDSSNNDAQEVKIKAIGDKLVEGNDYFTLLHKVDFENVKCNPCRNVMLFFKDGDKDTGLKSNEQNNFVTTDEYIITADDVQNKYALVKLNATFKNDTGNVSVWNDAGKNLSTKISRNILKIDLKSMNPSAGDRLYVNYAHEEMVVDNECAIQMQYDTSSIPDSGWNLEYLYDEELIEIDGKDSFNKNIVVTNNPDNSSKITVLDDIIKTSTGGVVFNFEYKQIITANEQKNKQIELRQMLHDSPVISFYDGQTTCYATYGAATKGYRFFYTVSEDGKHVKIYERVVNISFFPIKISVSNNNITQKVKLINYSAEKTLSLDDRYIDIPLGDAISETNASIQKRGHVEIHAEKDKTIGDRYYYKTAGTQLIICDAVKGQPVSVSGTFYFQKTVPGADESTEDTYVLGAPVVSIPDEPDPEATISEFSELHKANADDDSEENTVGRVVITQSSGSTDVSETSGVTDTYAISLSGPALENGETVKVSIKSLATTVYLEDGKTEDPAKQVEIGNVRFFDKNNKEVTDTSKFIGVDKDGDKYVVFNASNYDGYFEITVKGIDDNFVESDSPKLIAVGENTIENIKGALFEDGAGRKPDFDLDNPLMVRYGVKSDETKDEQNKPSNTYEKVQTKMAEKMESTDEYASVDRMFVNNMDNVKDNAVSSLNALDKVDPNVKTRKVEKIDANDTYNKKIGKSDSELYDSDRFSLRFKHSDISASGINFGNMEYAEINLGSGTDKVNINKTVYREDGFQTFTVVNSGSGKNETATGDRKENAPYDDEISINSYAAEERSVIASVSGLKKTANTDEIKYDLTGFVYKTGFDAERITTIKAENSYAVSMGVKAPHRVFLDVEFTDGTVQRREVVLESLSSTSVILKRDFTPVVAGVEIKSASLITNLSGDGILVVNAQGGDDKISATNSKKITREDLVLIGGTGADAIDVATNAIVFGDRGQVEYKNEDGKVVTRLGSLEISKTDKNADNLNKADYTTPTDKKELNYFQTDGVVRDAFVIKSMSDNVGGNDIIKTHGDKNVAIGGAGEDYIHLEGDNNVALGDNGQVEYESTVIDANNNKIKHVYGDSHKTYLHHIETTSDTMGGKDEITTGNGNNVVMGGTASDKIATGNGNDIIVGDGGEAYVDRNREALLVSNQGRNIEKLDDGSMAEDGSAGSDVIKTIGGDNVIFGGLNSQSRDFDFVKNEESKKWESTSVAENNEDLIVSGSGKDVIFGDNAYASFRGNYKMVEEKLDTELPTFQTGNSNEEREIKDQSILSFNFTGDSDKRITSEMEAGVEPAKNWNNISGHLSGTYGNNDNEIVRFDDGTRASAISVSYGGHENHRTTSTDSRINLQGYNHWMNGNDGNTILMNSGLMTTAPNQQCGSLLEVSVDGLAQYYESYYVFVYLDIPDSHSSYKESVRKITLSTEDGKYKKSFYIDDRAGKTFSGSFVQSSNETASAAIEAVKANDPKAVENYVVFRVEKQFATDRIIIKVEDGLNPYNYNGKDLPGIAGLQIKGDLHKQDVAVSTDIDFGGNDVVDTNGGDDIVVGGTGSDVIVTYGDERYSIDDNDVVYGDNAKLLFADRDNNPNTATTLTKAESIAATNLAATYNDAIRTGDGNDVVVGGIGSDAIFSGDVKVDDGTEETADRFEAVKDNDAEKNTDKVKLDNLEILSFNFTANNSGDEARVAHGVAAGVVVDDDWHDFYRNDRGVLMCDDTKAGWTPSEYENEVNKIANNHTFNTFATVNGVNVDLYGRSVQNNNSLGLSAYTQENVAELDGDTANSKIFNSSLALHSQEEIILKLSGLNNYLADKESGETKGDQKTYDVYVYLGGDNDNSDTYNFVYDIFSDSCGSYQGEHRYVNDWVGHFFDGDYREAKCTDANKARVVAENGVTPRIEMIGNYVVFRGVTGDNFTVHIRNYHIPGTNQWPKNLPVITAVQIVTGKGRFELNEDGNPKTVNGEKVRANVAIGGDHDKDLVFGDDAYLEFDVDIPFGVGEHINDFQNRVVSANSMAIKHDDAVKVDTRDIIYTGKDRDVVVGGEDADTIKTGAADDVVVGDNANLMMEHNNPIGVFTPSNEITLDDHTIDTSTKEDYLGHDNVTVDTIQRKYDPNWGNQNNGYMGWGPNGWGWYSYNNNNARGKIDGIKEPADTENTGRKDNIVDDEGSNLLIEGQWGTEKLYDPESLQPVEDPNVNTEDPNNGNEDPNVNTDDPNNENQDLREVFVGNMYGETKISIGAGETIKLVITNWDKGDQWYTPNIGIKVDASGRHSLVIKWDELGENASQEQSGNPEPISFENVAFVDIPNTSNVENEEKIVLYIHSEEAFQFSVYLINLG